MARALLASLTVLTTVATNFGVTPAASAAVGPAFTCSTATAFMSENTPASNSNTQLYSSAYGAGSVTFSPLGPRASLSYNALGYNPNDNYLYAIQTGTDDLVKIDSNGGATDLGSITGLPDPTGESGAYFVGAFDGTAAGATFWVTPGVVSVNGSTATKKAYQINVATRTVTKTLTLTQSCDPADFTASRRFMWGLETNSSTIDRLNLSTGAIDDVHRRRASPEQQLGGGVDPGQRQPRVRQQRQRQRVPDRRHEPGQREPDLHRRVDVLGPDNTSQRRRRLHVATRGHGDRQDRSSQWSARAPPSPGR